MARFVVSLAALLALLPASARALEFKNVRPSYGPLGATRQDTRCLPGDILFISYEIHGLKLDTKVKKAVYRTLLEVFDNSKPPKTIFQKETPNEVIPQLGGTMIPGDLHVIMGRNQAPGNYHVRLTVEDVQAKDMKSFVRTFELLPQSFGIVGVTAPAVAFPGQPYMAQFAIVDLGLDTSKSPKAKVEMKILDESGTPVSDPIVNNFPQDLTDNTDLKKENFVGMNFPIFPNRPGRFTIEISATDSVAQKTASIRYPLTVLDIASFTSK
jgi:hypothetical protein